MLKEEDPISSNMLAKYTKLSEKPLVEDVVQQFADFYCWQFSQACLV
jgi:hypothetical protein